MIDCQLLQDALIGEACGTINNNPTLGSSKKYEYILFPPRLIENVISVDERNFMDCMLQRAEKDLLEK